MAKTNWFLQKNFELAINRINARCDSQEEGAKNISRGLEMLIELVKSRETERARSEEVAARAEAKNLEDSRSAQAVRLGDLSRVMLHQPSDFEAI